MIGDHQELFGKGTLKSCGTDKGYYSAANRRYLQSLDGLDEFCLQQPGLDLSCLSEGEAEIHDRMVGARWQPRALIDDSGDDLPQRQLARDIRAQRRFDPQAARDIINDPDRTDGAAFLQLGCLFESTQNGEVVFVLKSQADQGKNPAAAFPYCAWWPSCLWLPVR
jgi:hypothetical protein